MVDFSQNRYEINIYIYQHSIYCYYSKQYIVEFFVTNTFIQGNATTMPLNGMSCKFCLQGYILVNLLVENDNRFVFLYSQTCESIYYIRQRSYIRVVRIVCRHWLDYSNFDIFIIPVLKPKEISIQFQVYLFGRWLNRNWDFNSNMFLFSSCLINRSKICVYILLAKTFIVMFMYNS